MRLLERYIAAAGDNGRSVLQCVRYGVRDLGFTRKTARQMLEDMEFCGDIKVRGSTVTIRKTPPQAL